MSKGSAEGYIIPKVWNGTTYVPKVPEATADRAGTVYLTEDPLTDGVIACGDTGAVALTPVSIFASDGKVKSSILPSYVDDVIDGYYYNNKFYKDAAHTQEIQGESHKIYIDLTSSRYSTYRYDSASDIFILTSSNINDAAIDGKTIMYAQDSILKESVQTVGNNTNPVYLNAGKITVCANHTVDQTIDTASTSWIPLLAEGALVDGHGGAIYTGVSVKPSANAIKASGGLYMEINGTETNVIGSDGKVYNAVWNDYAELFKKDPDEEILPHKIAYIWEDGLVHSTGESSCAIGIYSDSYGHLLGGEGDPTDSHYVPIGLAGRVKLEVKELVNLGDLISADTDGYGRKATKEDFGCILGKCTKIYNDKLIELLICLG